MTFLLDVNVLIALVDPAHIHHEAAHKWFADEGAGSWATCPVTENGLVRIMSNPRYGNTPRSPGAIIALLAALREHPGHMFWADTVSLADMTRFAAALIGSHAQVTDVYLLGLAVEYGGRLATFDRRLPGAPVEGGGQALCLIQA